MTLTIAIMILVSTQALGAGQINLNDAVVVTSPSQKLHAKAAQMLTEEIEKRTRITLAVSDKMPAGKVPTIIVGTVKDFPVKAKLPKGVTVPEKADSYAIWVKSSSTLPNNLRAHKKRRSRLF